MKAVSRTILILMGVFILQAGSAQLASAQSKAVAVFAGGCFWSMEAAFDKVKGVSSAVSGFAGGKTTDPTYEDVVGGGTGHLEAVQVTYDPKEVSYAELLDVYWRSIDPTDAGGSFYDRGHQYTSAVFYGNAAEKALAEESKKALDKSGRFKKPVVTKIREAAKFYAADEKHQNYAETNADHYARYRRGSGRDKFFEQIWGKKK
jgi:methionine-S-sulfoxide reductase